MTSMNLKTENKTSSNSKVTHKEYQTYSVAFNHDAKPLYKNWS